MKLHISGFSQKKSKPDFPGKLWPPRLPASLSRTFFSYSQMTEEEGVTNPLHFSSDGT